MVIRSLPFIYTNIKYIQDAQPGDNRADKAACEILLLCWGLYRNTYILKEDGKIIGSILDVAETRLRGQAVTQGLLWRPSRVPMLCMGSALLNQIGRHNWKFDNVAELSWRKSFVESSERSPFQSLETQWCLAIFGSSSSIKIPADSLILRKPFTLVMSTEDAYAFTHSIFYTSNFGRSDPPPEVAVREVWDVINSGIVWSLLRFDFDLLSEFLLSAICYQMPYTPEMQLGFFSLLATWDENGFVPDREIELGERRDSRHIFYSIYHANLVAAYLLNEVLLRNIDLDTPVVPLSVSKSSLQSIYLELDKWLVGKKHISSQYIFELIDIEVLLKTILGNNLTHIITRNICKYLFTYLNSDFLITYGFIYKDINAVFAGVYMSTSNDNMTWNIICAIKWLMMFQEISTKLESDSSQLSLKIIGILKLVHDKISLLLIN